MKIDVPTAESFIHTLIVINIAKTEIFNKIIKIKAKQKRKRTRTRTKRCVSRILMMCAFI